MCGVTISTYRSTQLVPHRLVLRVNKSFSMTAVNYWEIKSISRVCLRPLERELRKNTSAGSVLYFNCHLTTKLDLSPLQLYNCHGKKR